MRLVGTVCCVALMLSACGNSTASDVVEAASTTEVSTTAPLGDVVPIEAPACELLTSDEVASAVGLDVAAALMLASLAPKLMGTHVASTLDRE